MLKNVHKSRSTNKQRILNKVSLLKQTNSNIEALDFNLDDDDSDIMNFLNYKRLGMIYEDYKLLGGKEGLSLEHFVKVML